MALSFETLFAKAASARTLCHAPYSNFPVGVALEDEHGNIHVGANIENASYPEGWCAETSAISHLIMAGSKKIVQAVVVAPRIPGNRFCTPCGGCRQRLAEFGTAETVVYSCDPEGASLKRTLAELLPEGFALTQEKPGF